MRARRDRSRLLEAVLCAWALTPLALVLADALAGVARPSGPARVDLRHVCAVALAHAPWPDEVCENCGAAGAALESDDCEPQK